MAIINKIIISFILFLLIIIFIGVYLSYSYPTTSPLKSAYYFFLRLRNPHDKMKKETMGFLTYWRSEDADIKNIQHNLLSEIIYFNLSVDKDGHIVRVVNNETDPGWLLWKDQKIRDLIAKTQIMGGKFSLSLAMLRNNIIEPFLENPQAQQNLINEIGEEIKKNKLDAINLDFEYTGSPEAKLRDQFTAFAGDFTSKLRSAYPKIEITIDVYPLSIRKQRLIDIPKVEPFFDKFIIMTYDFYAMYSNTTGPIAPISGYAQKKYIFDIETTYEDFVKYVGLNKLILGIPYYGYDWPVETADKFMSRTLDQDDQNGYVEVLSYSRMRKEPRYNSPDNCKWDLLAQAPWCWYIDENTNIGRQAWFENTKSIEAKFNYVNNKNFSGLAIWALGYDRDYMDLWNMIKTKFTQ